MELTAIAALKWIGGVLQVIGWDWELIHPNKRAARWRHPAAPGGPIADIQATNRPIGI